jgi:hypothetical protein
MKTINVIGGLVVLSAAGYGISRLLKTNNTGNKTSVSITGVNPPKIQGAAIVLAVDVAFDNPTKDNLVLMKPYLTAIYNGNEVGNSAPSGETISIKANERTIIKGINLQIPISKIGALAVTLFQSKVKKLALDIIVKTIANGIPYTDKEHFDL